jgi:SAM-dependent methyltransferase
MGLHLNLAYLLHQITKPLGLAGPVCALGIQNMPFTAEQLRRVLPAAPSTGPVTQNGFFAALGFSGAEAVDFSDYEGAEHIFDLNEPTLPTDLHCRYDLVWDGGTLEHVFHVPNALANIARMLRPGGLVVHASPCNNWVEHGFYQFSPTLMFDYYASAGYTVVGSFLCRFRNETSHRWRIEPAVPGALASGGAGNLNDDVCLLLFAARRGDVVKERSRPIQRLYANNPTSAEEVRRLWFRPYVLDNGIRTDPTPTAEINLGRRIRPELGACWCVDLPELAKLSDSSDSPSRSTLIVLEDGRPLGPPHSAHDLIRSAGHGSLSHWGDALYFSTSDNTDPRINGRAYSAFVPG